MKLVVYDRDYHVLAETDVSTIRWTMKDRGYASIDDINIPVKAKGIPIGFGFVNGLGLLVHKVMPFNEWRGGWMVHPEDTLLVRAGSASFDYALLKQGIE